MGSNPPRPADAVVDAGTEAKMLPPPVDREVDVLPNRPPPPRPVAVVVAVPRREVPTWKIHNFYPYMNIRLSLISAQIQ